MEHPVKQTLLKNMLCKPKLKGALTFGAVFHTGIYIELISERRQLLRGILTMFTQILCLKGNLKF